MPTLSARRFALVPLVAAGLLAAPLPTQAATSTVTVSHVDTIPQSLGGTKADTYDQSVIRQIDRVRKGGAVYVGIYSLSAPDVTDALFRMVGRGGRLYFLTWKQNGGNQDEEGRLTSSELMRVQSFMAARPSAGWFKACTGGCRRSGTTGIQHVKVWAFDFGDGSYAVEQGSGNSTGDTNGRAFNSFDVLSGKGVRPVFDQYRSYIVSSRADKTLPDVKDVTVRMKDGTVTSRLFPNRKGDLMHSELRAARGFKAKKGEPGCHVVLDQFKTTVNRLSIYDEAIRVKKQGCARVEVDVNWRDDNAARFESKVREMSKAGVEVYDMSYAPKYPQAHYGHDKLAGGIVKDSKGRLRYWRVNGSLTASASATTVSSEQQLLFVSKSEAQHVFDRQDEIRKYLRRL